ncbi:TMEM175 family protein [Mesorhizobium sp. J8]|uniref:TMEM175 family protein n=1 Tax=Mesorhizobium sp. J8 TaxID=2777475 RepID=UPI0021E6335E|nr:TMEM175 family protein [Mesorhizobium sp. J8]
MRGGSHEAAARTVGGRIVGITDGVFAIALTLIVLEIRVPSHEAVHSEGELVPRSSRWRHGS